MGAMTPTAPIFDIQRFSLHDGPGIRTSVFLKGCPLSCCWCHNPEGVNPDTELWYNEGRCIHCEYCVAVCPHGALSHEVMNTTECPPVRDELNLQPDQVEQFLRSRRSIRTYKKKQVDRDVLTKLIKLASFAPSGHNTQPVNWLVIYDSDEVQRLAGIVAEWMGSLRIF